ncbi:MAG: YncE family protein, partial [candidate division WOR-3 bacterium]
CYNTSLNKLYTANEDGDNVTVIDGLTGSTLATIPVEELPQAICYNQTDDKVYCASLGFLGSYLSIIDCATDRVTATPDIGRYPRALFHNPLTDRVYSAGSAAGTVTVVDGVTNSVLTTIPVGEGPMAMAWSPEFNRVYVSNAASSNISVIRDSVPGGVEEERTEAEGQRTSQTICRGMLVLPGGMADFGRRESERILRHVLLDVAGRKVMDLPGVLASGASGAVRHHDIGHLAPGVYFVAQDKGCQGVNSIGEQIVVLR